MNPPLRTPKDVEALKQGLKDGTIEVISTDHAPHSAQEKTGSMKNAPFGIVGLETSLPLTYTELVEKDVITLKQMVEKMCLNPAKILGLDRGTLQKGHPADVSSWILSRSMQSIKINLFPKDTTHRLMAGK